MGRLIDADLLKECYAGTNALDGKADYMSIRKMIDNQPTAYDVEKVVAELEQQAEKYRNRGFEHATLGYSLSADKCFGKQCSYLHAIDIVKMGGVE